ncbi:MAG: hydrogenase maturation protease [Chloroflexota bacterium]|nr:hydrogenase maturation protease [Chloroflexota bacterium]
MNKNTVADSEHARPATLIVGLGNPLRGDDGVGPRVVEELLRREIPSHVEVLDAGSGGLDLLHILKGRELAVVVDSARLGEDPGQFIRFTPSQVELAPRSFNPHHASLAEVMTLARALGQPLPRIVVFGIQAAKLDWGEGLSPAVENTIPKLIAAILREVSTLVD